MNYWEETYRGNHIALLKDKGNYSAYINKQLLHCWKISKLESGQRLLRTAIDELEKQK